MIRWEERRILILGTTYPSYSKSYTETVCAGGIDEQTRRLIRIHPVPQRYLEPEHKLRAFQWIRVDAAKNEEDPRPESYRVAPTSIVREEEIPSSAPDERRHVIESCAQVFDSVEQLRSRWEHDRTSLGIVKPQTIGEPNIATRSPKERREWLETERTVLSQHNLWGDLKPLDFPEWKFMVPWQCDDACEGHTMHLNDWSIHELARKYRAHPEGREKVLEAMRKRLSINGRDVYLFLGNYRTKLYNFGLMGSYSAPVQQQGNLFG